MTRTIQDTCHEKTVRSAEVQDVLVHLPVTWERPHTRTFTRGPGHIPRDVVDFAARQALKGRARSDLFLTDPMGNVLWPADIATADEGREVLRKFRRASSLFVYLRLHGVTP